MKLSKIQTIISNFLKEEKFIKSARIYGSSLYSPRNIFDIDVALMISSNSGIVNHSIYEKLCKIRKRLCDVIKADIDIVPHTKDEIKDVNSTLWHPRYHPSLTFGRDIKGRFPVPKSSLPPSIFKKRVNLASYNLYDTRAVTRRQALRFLKGESARIFIAKIAHGPGNALTKLSLEKRSSYKVNPSDIKQSFKIFESVYKIDSKEALIYIKESEDMVFSKEGKLSFKRALNLLSWYELLVAKALGNNDAELRKFLDKLGKINPSITKALWEYVNKN